MEARQDRILIVDDDPLNVRVLVEFLRADYSLSIARDGAQTLERLQSQPLPDLILLDVMMPMMDGYEVCRRIKADPATQAVPVMFVTAMNQPFDESAAFEAGAVDFLTKPIAPGVLRARVRTQLRLRQTERTLLRHNAQLEETVLARIRELSGVANTLTHALAALSARRDGEVDDVLEHGAQYLVTLARAAMATPAFAGTITETFVEALLRMAPLREIGKLAVADPARPSGGDAAPDDPSRPSREGAAALRAARHRAAAEDVPALDVAIALVETRHARWDGTGSPAGLAGEDIPLAGRLISLVDDYDLQTAGRGGRAMVAHGVAVERIRAGAGTRYDPRLVAAFLEVAAQFRLISGQAPCDPA